MWRYCESNFRKAWVRLSKIEKNLNSRYFQNQLSDLPVILESGPDFCKDHAKRDDANQSEHFLHMFFTFRTFFAHFYFILARESQN